MDKLANYGSDEESEDSTSQYDQRAMGSSTLHTSNQRTAPAKHGGDNYEEVQMDMSEDSAGSDASSKLHPKERVSSSRDKGNYESNNKSRGDKNSSRSRDYKSKRDDSGDRYRSKREDHDREDRYKDRKSDDRHGGRDRYRGSDRGKDTRERYRNDRRQRRSSSRDRRSRSPHRNDYRSGKQSGRDAKMGYGRKFDRANEKMAHLEKLGISFNCASDGQKLSNEAQSGTESNRFFMPGVTGRFRDQIERRKLLWQKKEPESKEENNVKLMGGAGTGKVWETTTFAQDSDGKIAGKFKRLMGIKQTVAEPKSTLDGLKKQEEMFSSMEAQYEVARTATHTMRGVGLGFGSFQR